MPAVMCSGRIKRKSRDEGADGGLAGTSLLSFSPVILYYMQYVPSRIKSSKIAANLNFAAATIEADGLNFDRKANAEENCLTQMTEKGHCRLLKSTEKSAIFHNKVFSVYIMQERLRFITRIIFKFIFIMIARLVEKSQFRGRGSKVDCKVNF